MKLSSPFIQYIPECKRKMRRLRKKIYKYITSKNYKKPTPHKRDVLHIFKQAEIPSFLTQILSKKKGVELNILKNIAVSSRLPLSEIMTIASKQQANIKENHSKWQIQEALRLKQKQKKLQDLAQIKQMLSKRTISSTEYSEFEGDQYQNPSLEGYNLMQSHSQLDCSSYRNAGFNPFIAGSRFLEMESSNLSLQNLFK